MSRLREWSGALPPAPDKMSGHLTVVRPFDSANDAEALYDAIGADADLWTYIPFGPPVDAAEMTELLAEKAETQGWRTFVIQRRDDDRLQGMASYMRVRPEHGSAEVGCIVYSKALQRTPMATEAMYLMARHIFDDLGYRRYEWKCDNANKASKRAALRYGFTFEGVFRNDMVIKGRNRDTAWYSIIDEEWPLVKAAFEAWLSPDNFDAEGRQRKTLEKFRVS